MWRRSTCEAFGLVWGRGRSFEHFLLGFFLLLAVVLYCSLASLFTSAGGHML